MPGQTVGQACRTACQRYWQAAASQAARRGCDTSRSAGAAGPSSWLRAEAVRHTGRYADALLASDPQALLTQIERMGDFRIQALIEEEVVEIRLLRRREGDAA